MVKFAIFFGASTFCSYEIQYNDVSLPAKKTFILPPILEDLALSEIA